MTFLEKIADELIERKDISLADTCIVLPNRRAGIFLKKYLSSKLNSVSWIPTIFSGDDFIFHISRLSQAEPLSQLLTLFNAYNGIAREKQSLDVFLGWGQTVLQDFNEIDAYLADPEEVYAYLSELKVLEKWNPGMDELTGFQKSYLDFYNTMAELYAAFTKSLSEQNLATQGMAYRQATLSIKDIGDDLPWKRILFAGFNAFTPSEEYVFSELKKNGLAEYYFDADIFYINDKMQEAGSFLRPFFEDHKTKWLEDNLIKGEKNISVIGVPGSTGQAKMAGTILRDMYDNEDSWDETALVLADESLLIPVLNAIPKATGECNVTMGFPLQQTPAFAFIDAIFNLFITGERWVMHRKSKDVMLYHRDLIRLISHPYFQRFTGNHSKLKESFIKKNRSFITRRDFVDFIEENDVKLPAVFQEFLLKDKHDAKEFLRFLRDLILEVKNALVDDKSKSAKLLDAEYLFEFFKLINKMIELAPQLPENVSLSTFYTLFSSLLKTSNLSFYGEPLSGLQLMGVLETRTLDFKNLILLSANEGKIPSGSKQNSFIPFDVRKDFGLPTFQTRDSIFAYHFFRLLQRAENVYYIYDIRSSGMGMGEKSRFIQQLKHELLPLNPKIRFSEKFASGKLNTRDNVPDNSFPKNEEVMNRLHQMAEYGLSPSALNKFRNCPLQFYLSYIVGLKEADEIEETIEAAGLGTITHKVLENLYAPYLSAKIDERIIEKIKQEAAIELEKVFVNEYGSFAHKHGKNLLIYNVIKVFLEEFFNKEKEFVEKSDLLYVAGEKEIRKEYPCNIPNVERVFIKGTIDRIDCVDDEWRVIDYKTGKVQKNEINVKSLKDLADEGHDKSFQLMLYACLFNWEFPDRLPLSSAIISFRNLKEFPVILSCEQKELLIKEDIEQFRIILDSILTKLFDPTLDFEMTSNSKYCEYCSFYGFCHE